MGPTGNLNQAQLYMLRRGRDYGQGKQFFGRVSGRVFHQAAFLAFRLENERADRNNDHF
tara:strand:+ start:12063 stop:12239 length:177 start_codon:yes stop_codon:yes gene_type:complete